MKAVEFYTMLVKSLDFTIGADDSLSTADYFGSQPIMIENEGTKKRLYLPTKSALSTYNQEVQVLFHPLAEYITIGESDIFKALKTSIRLALITRIAWLMEALAVVGASTDLHERMTPSQLKFLEQVAGIDANSVNLLKDVLSKTLEDEPTKTLLTLFMTRETVVEETKYPRVCNVSFPFLKVLGESAASLDSKHKVLGISVRKKTPDDIKIWKGLFTYIFPNSATPTSYSKGSDHYAPYFGALLSVYYEIQSRLNIVISEFKSFLVLNDYVKLVDLTWYGIFESGTVVNDLPNLGGNKGGIIEREIAKPTAPVEAIDSPPWSTEPTSVNIPNYVPNIPKTAALGIEEIRRNREAAMRGDRPGQQTAQPNRGGYQPSYGNQPINNHQPYTPPRSTNWRDLV